jgi:hypothetical protein
MKMVDEDGDGDNESDPDRPKTNAALVGDLREKIYCLRHLEKNLSDEYDHCDTLRWCVTPRVKMCFTDQSALLNQHSG